MSRQLSSEELAEAEECFSVFSKNGHLGVGDIGMAMRSLGHNPSNSEVDQIIKEMRITSSITLDVFKKILTRDLPSANTAEEIREAFGIFDRDGNGTISAHELKHILMSSGEKLTEDEVNLMIREADIDSDGHIYYEQFVQTMAKK